MILVNEIINNVFTSKTYFFTKRMSVVFGWWILVM